VWDKLFGTFQQELKEVPPVYGITRPAQTWNPIKINFQHLWLLLQDAWRTKSIKDKLRIWMMPTGWRPADVEAKYPVHKIEDVYHFTKYSTPETKPLLVWCWVQLVVLLLLVSYLFGNIAFIGSPAFFLYGGFIFLFVYAFTELMDGSRYTLFWELLKNSTGIAMIFFFNDWFGVERFWQGINYILLEYFVISMVVTIWLVRQNKKPAAVQPV
jgi:alkylglycerol monooxygenase